MIRSDLLNLRDMLARLRLPRSGDEQDEDDDAPPDRFERAEAIAEHFWEMRTGR